MSSTKIKLIGLLILMGCATAEAGTVYRYETPNGTILTGRKVDNPDYKFVSATTYVHSKNFNDTSSSTKATSTKTTNRKVGKPGDERITLPPGFSDSPGPGIETKTTSTNSVSTRNVSKVTKTISTNSVNASNVSKFYEPLNFREEEKKNFEYLKPGGQVEVLEILPGLDSYNSFTAQGYSPIGQSAFRDWNLSKDSLIAQAKKVGATFVTFSKYAQSSVSYTMANDPKNLATVDPNNLPIIYGYDVIFYVKDNYIKNPNVLGIKMSNISLDKRNTYQRNTGVYVVNVVQGSKAYNANVLNEDVIIAINDNPILTADDFQDIKEKELKKTKILNLKILRLVNKELKELNIPVNF